MPSPRRGHAPAKASLSFLLAGALLANLPLALLLGLKAQLRYLAHLGEGPAQSVVSKVYETETLPRSLAFNLEPEAVLQSRTIETSRPNFAPFLPPDSTTPPDPGRPDTPDVVRGHDVFDGGPPRRVYDPVGPPPLTL